VKPDKGRHMTNKALVRTPVKSLATLLVCAGLGSCSLIPTTTDARLCIPAVRAHALENKDLTPADREIIERQDPTIAYAEGYADFYFMWFDPAKRLITNVDTSPPPRCEPHPPRTKTDGAALGVRPSP
jgi:hypothetical protein